MGLWSVVVMVAVLLVILFLNPEHEPKHTEEGFMRLAELRELDLAVGQVSCLAGCEDSSNTGATCTRRSKQEENSIVMTIGCIGETTGAPSAYQEPKGWPSQVTDHVINLPEVFLSCQLLPAQDNPTPVDFRLNCQSSCIEPLSIMTRTCQLSYSRNIPDSRLDVDLDPEKKPSLTSVDLCLMVILLILVVLVLLELNQPGRKSSFGVMLKSSRLSVGTALYRPLKDDSLVPVANVGDDVVVVGELPPAAMSAAWEDVEQIEEVEVVSDHEEEQAAHNRKQDVFILQHSCVQPRKLPTIKPKRRRNKIQVRQ